MCWRSLSTTCSGHYQLRRSLAISSLPGSLASEGVDRTPRCTGGGRAHGVQSHRAPKRLQPRPRTTRGRREHHADVEHVSGGLERQHRT
jgi:hypothetical protein